MESSVTLKEIDFVIKNLLIKNYLASMINYTKYSGKKYLQHYTNSSRQQEKWI